MAFPTLQSLLILLIPGNSEGFEAAPMDFTLQRFLNQAPQAGAHLVS